MNQFPARVVVPTQAKISPMAAKRSKNRAAVALGRLGGKAGGPARAASLTSQQRVSIAMKGAEARWGPAVEYKQWRSPLKNIGTYIFEDYEPAMLDMNPSAPVTPAKNREKILIIVKAGGEHGRSFIGQEAYEVRALLNYAGING